MLNNPIISGGGSLPALTNPGTASDLLTGKQLIDQNGNIVTGTLVYAGAIVPDDTGYATFFGDGVKGNKIQMDVGLLSGTFDPDKLIAIGINLFTTQGKWSTLQTKTASVSSPNSLIIGYTLFISQRKPIFSVRTLADKNGISDSVSFINESSSQLSIVPYLGSQWRLTLTINTMGLCSFSYPDLSGAWSPVCFLKQ